MKKLEKDGEERMTNPKKDWKEGKDPFLEREKQKKNWKEKDLF